MKPKSATFETGSILLQVLNQHREEVLNAWLSKNTDASHQHVGVSQNGQLRERMSQFIDALKDVLDAGMDNITGKDSFRSALRLSQEESSIHPNHVVSQAGSAHFLFSLRQTLLSFIQEASNGSLECFAREMEALNQVIDSLRMAGLEHYIQAREKVITGQSRAMVELAEASMKAKSLFLASMSHEIRTPINAILGMGELLAESALEPEQEQYVRISNKAGKTLLALINDILDLSKIEAGQLELEAMDFNLTGLIQDVVEILSLQARDKGLVLEIKPDPYPNDLWVTGDSMRLQQIVLNLLSNAIKFTAEGRVVIRLDPNRDGLVSISISDTGIGIPEEKHQHIFQPFTQADATVSRQYRGTGLGLAICRQLAEKMEGRIDLESTVGVGSVFSLSVPLPVAKPPEFVQQEAAIQAWEEYDEHGLENKPLTILLVDDAADNRLICKAFLMSSGYKIKMASDGTEALMRFREERFDLVFTDIEMPVMDGYTATRAMRAWEREKCLPPTPIIALTAHAMREHAERSVEAGCDFHLTKPFRKLQLLECIERFGSKNGAVERNTGSTLT